MHRLPLVALLLLSVLARAQDLHFAADRPLDLLHVRLDARVDLKNKTLKGKETLEMVALRATRTIRLDAVDLQVEAVDVVRGDAAQFQEVEYVNDGKHLDIALPQELARGERLTVTVEYTCTDPERGLFFFGPTKRQPDVPYQVWSQGETIDNRHWIPLFDHPNERTTSELLITTDADQQVLSNGKRIAVRRNEDGSVTWHWRQAEDHAPYLITLVVGQFAITKQSWRGRPVEYWVPPDRKDDTMRSFSNTLRMLDFFSDRIGVEYPWDKYTQVVVEQFSFGGMENTSATTLNERTLHDERAHLDYSSDGLVSHEMAHQWFGDLLTCRDWAHVWLNEGFASYFQALWTEESLGRDEFLYDMRGKAKGAIDGGRKFPIVHRAYEGPWQQFDARAYPKGAWVLHMIRRRLGDELWWKSIKHYVETNAHKAVETVDLRKAIEETTGVSFERFFYDWTTRPAHPVVKVTHRWRAAQNAAEVRIQQTQKEGAWHFPLKIEYRFPELSRAMSITQDVTEKDVRFFVPLPARPSLVSVDPDNAVLMELTENKGRDLWINQLRHDANPLARIRAAEHFGKSRRDADRKLLAGALGQEKFWGVQAEIATALGASGGNVSRAILLQALSLENPKARRAVVKALGKFKGDDVVRDALEGIVRNGDASYSVEADAISAWAGLRPEGALARLEPLLARESHNHEIRAAVLKSIGNQLDPAATDLLLAWTEPGKPRPCRTAALEGLATLATSGEWDDATTNRVVKAVSGCLDSSEHRSIKTQAAQTLRVLGEAAAPALAALEAISEHDPNENVRKQAQETIDKIRNGAQPRLELQRLRDELRKLREANRKLEDRIERLDGKRASSDGD